MKCSQCEKPAMFLVGREGKQIPLCLDCNLKLVQLTTAQNDMLERLINYCGDYIDLASGLPGFSPRFPESKVLHAGDITLNNIKIDKSVIGILNTGAIQTVDLAVTAIQHSGNEELSSAILELSTAVLTNSAINSETKNQVLEILSVLATEATAPKDKRRSSAMRALLQELGTIFGGIPGLIELWNHVKPILDLVF